MAYLPDWLSNAGSSAYNWAGENPFQAASLGFGAFGTGMGLWDQYQANQQLDQRRKLAESFLKMGPYAFAPQWNAQQLAAMYFRPASQFMAGQGQTDGGSYQAALAQAALAADKDRFQLGNQALSAKMAGLGYGSPVPASGNVGAFGQSLQNLMLQQALASRNQRPPQQPYNPSSGPTTFNMPGMTDQSNPANFYQQPPNAAWSGIGDAANSRYNAGFPAPGGRDSFLGRDE